MYVIQVSLTASLFFLRFIVAVSSVISLKGARAEPKELWCRPRLIIADVCVKDAKDQQGLCVVCHAVHQPVTLFSVVSSVSACY